MNTVQSLEIVHRVLVEVVEQGIMPKKRRVARILWGELIELIAAWLSLLS